jgi:hypothetical protein
MITMMTFRLRSLLLTSAIAAVLVPLASRAADPAPASPQTRAQVQMEAKEFLLTHRWDDANDVWVLKSGVEPPKGVVSRQVVRNQREEFLRLNRWDEASQSWVSRKPVPASLSALSRQQVREETKAFLKTHHWDEDQEAWTDNHPARKKK